MLSRRAFLQWTAAGLVPCREVFALEAGAPSRTARGTALQRAAHQLLETPKVLDDPIALPILGTQDLAWLGRNLERYQSAGSRAMRAFLVMRSRFAEDELALAMRRGVRQYVVLGAGLDTFAYRNAARELRVFEVDHPATQDWKRSCLREGAIEIPRTLHYAPVDFETERLADGLRAAGFRSEEPTFFSWLGVVIYLTKEAVESTLRTIASCAKGSQVVFDFAPPPAALADAERRSHDALAARAASAGEPWINYYRPEALALDLRAAGFSSARHFGSDEMNERYFAGRIDGFRLYGSGRMMTAQA